jgi:hypothetical protein
MQSDQLGFAITWQVLPPSMFESAADVLQHLCNAMLLRVYGSVIHFTYKVYDNVK